MATSRRRERELARRRFERRRQAEMERRARAKRRNNVLGASIGTVVVLAALGVGGYFAFGHHHHKAKPTAGAKPGASATSLVTPTPTPTPTTPAPPAPTKCAPIKPNPPAHGQLTVPDVKGKVSKKLVVKDIKVGHGLAAKDGDTVKVFYIGASCTTGKVFDASYLHKPLAPLTVTPLGKASVIAGFNKGLVGIKPGGERELIIPASLGYGAAGSPPSILGNDTLIFLITAQSVKA